MKFPKHGTSKTYYRSGGPAGSAPQADCAAPAVVPEEHIASYSGLKTANKPMGAYGPGTPDPSLKDAGKHGMGTMKGTAPGKRRRGGDSMAGSHVTKTDQGTNNPKSKKGPSGLGLYGSKYAPFG